MSIWASLPAPDDYGEQYGRPGEDDPPIIYQASHVLPSLDDERGGSVNLAYIPPHVRFWRENPDANSEDEPDSDHDPVEPFLRFGVNDERVILTRKQAEEVYESIKWFLEHS